MLRTSHTLNMRNFSYTIAVAFICLSFGIAHAQVQEADSAQQGVVLQPPTEPAPAPKPLSVQDDTDVRGIQSLFFTSEALALIRDAIRGLNTSTVVDSGDNAEKEPGIRELALGGIIYKASDDWTIWLNGRRITPDTIPGEVFDLDVKKNHVDLKWFDAYTNRLFPIRLRANERFNLDSRLFLTGTHADDQQL